MPEWRLPSWEPSRTPPDTPRQQANEDSTLSEEVLFTGTTREEPEYTARKSEEDGTLQGTSMATLQRPLCAAAPAAESFDGSRPKHAAARSRTRGKKYRTTLP